MQVLILALLCATCGRAWAGAVAWPGALPLAFPGQAVRTLVPGVSKGFAYSTSQYINALPVQYSFGFRPQVSFTSSQSLAPFTALQPGIYPAAGQSFYPHFNPIYYPSLSPVFSPQAPVSVPDFPPPSTETPTGDSDTAVVDSAETPSQPPIPSQPSSDPQFELNPSGVAPSQPEVTPQAPSNDASPPSFPQFPLPTIPNQPSFPQFPSSSPPGFPSFPQFPQGGDSSIPSFPQPSIPQFPSIPHLPESSSPGFPAFPQPSLPQFPGSFPNFPPKIPNTPGEINTSGISSFPGSVSSGGNEDKGLNDEDTISVDSA